MIMATIRRFRKQFKPVKGEGCKSIKRQYQEVCSLGLRYKFTPREYYLYGFYKKAITKQDMLNYMTNYDVTCKYRPLLNDNRWVPLLGNKWLFHLHYSTCGIPVTNVFGYFHPQAGVTKGGEPLRTNKHIYSFLQKHRPTSLVIKPVGGVVGKGLRVINKINYNSEMSFYSITGEQFGFDSIAQHCTQREDGLIYDGYLLEEKLNQHEFLQEINPYTMNSIRVVTFIQQDGDIQVHFAILRLGRQGSVVDNWDKGGLSVYVNPETGELGQGVFKPKHGQQWVNEHPDTGVIFTGRCIPLWEEIIDTCKLAASCSPHLLSVGWDVILTPTGPVLIEGNHNWDLMMVQVHSNGYLQEPVRKQLGKYGLEFPSAKL